MTDLKDKIIVESEAWSVQHLKDQLDKLEVAIRLDERERVVEEVESWLVDEEYPITDPESIDYGEMLEHPWNEYRAELRTKLTQLKGEVK